MKKIWMMILGVSLLFMLAACGGSSEEASETSGEETSSKEPTVETIEEGKFTFGFSGLYKPFNFEDIDGNLTGFEVELGEAIAKEMGLEPNPVATQDFGALIEEVNSGRLDAIMGSMTITEERSEAIDFSDPYYRGGGVVYVHKDNNDIKSTDDLEGKTIGVIASSTHEQSALEFITEDTLATYSSDVVALQDLAAGTGRLDAAIVDKFVGHMQIEEEDMPIKPISERLNDEEIGAGFKKGNEELVKEFNRALQAVIDNGTYDEISNKWFGENILE
ncbi:transporter substrate-binding domain-containing protein [Siminovitchia sediminis]|uniref:Transporter substrate-binding domain-containing protein n=1 Tax=Siminovitchia sediminis TaxID=1274353 RepID=A0ABW4KDA1_9BACI